MWKLVFVSLATMSLILLLATNTMQELASAQRI